MNFKLKNTINDVEILVEYTHINMFGLKIYYSFMSMIAILTPTIICSYFFINDVMYSDNYFLTKIISLVIIIVFVIILTLIIKYIFLNLLPKLIRKRYKKFASDVYKKSNIFFSAEKIIIIKDEYIEVSYNEKKLNIKLGVNTFVDEFKGYIIISEIFMKNKIKKVYPLVIPITIFESQEEKEEFIGRLNIGQ